MLLLKKNPPRLDTSVALSNVPISTSKAYGLLRDLLGGMPVFGGYSSFSEIFAKFDKDVSGKINLQELQSTLKEMGLPLSDEQAGFLHISIIVYSDVSLLKGGRIAAGT